MELFPNLKFHFAKRKRMDFKTWRENSPAIFEFWLVTGSAFNSNHYSFAPKVCT